MKPHIEELTDWLEERGAVVTSTSQGRKHAKIWFEYRGREHLYVVGTTPSDWRANLNAKADLRHMMGLVNPVKRVGKRRRQVPRGRCAGAAPMEIPTITGGPDWQSPLDRHPLAAEVLRRRLDAAWLAFWRHCMASVGARSLL